MKEMIKIGKAEIEAKEYQGQRVVTFKDIDLCHGRPEGTARKRFNDNKQHMIEGVDYFQIQKSEKRTLGIEVPNRGITAVTQSGYLMLVKSFTDDLAWDVQRDMVNTYFKEKAVEDGFNAMPDDWKMMFKIAAETALIKKQQAEQAAQIESTNKRIDNLSKILQLNSKNWREDSVKIMKRIGYATGDYKQVWADVYSEVERRGGFNLKTRLAHAQENARKAGVPESVIGKMKNLHVIEMDKRLIEIYLAIVKECAVRNGVSADDID